jgi:hypothetical protein
MVCLGWAPPLSPLTNLPPPFTPTPPPDQPPPRSHPTPPKVDVYSFGIVMWELWTQREPFEVGTSVGCEVHHQLLFTLPNITGPPVRHRTHPWPTKQPAPITNQPSTCPGHQLPRPAPHDERVQGPREAHDAGRAGLGGRVPAAAGGRLGRAPAGAPLIPFSGNKNQADEIHRSTT